MVNVQQHWGRARRWVLVGMGVGVPCASQGSCPPTDPADPCQTNPCLHGGTSRANGTVCGCSCVPGFTGENCEIGECPEHPHAGTPLCQGRIGP